MIVIRKPEIRNLRQGEMCQEGGVIEMVKGIATWVGAFVSGALGFLARSLTGVFNPSISGAGELVSLIAVVTVCVMAFRAAALRE
jgi:hypothetical protein